MRRASRDYVLGLFEKNPDWNILDLGGGRDPWTAANTVFDIEDYSSDHRYSSPSNRFVQGEAGNTPFKDKEFDFVTACHIIEHVPDPKSFCDDLMRIGKRGYIEFPTPLFDNLIEGNDNPPPHGHVWSVTFDDDIQKIIFKPKKIVAPVRLTFPNGSIDILNYLHPRTTTYLMPFFKDSMVTGIFWEKEIMFEVQEPIFTYNAGNSDPNITVDLSKDHEASLREWTSKIYFSEG